MPTKRKPRATMPGQKKPRRENDAYMTPLPLARAIVARIAERFGDFDCVIEPSAGTGTFVRAARDRWMRARIVAVEPCGAHAKPVDERTIVTPLHDAGADHVLPITWEACTSDALDVPDDASTLIVGNPPYNLPGDGIGEKPTTAERHAILGVERLKKPDVLAFLLRLAFFGGGGRIARLYSKHALAAAWPITPRPSFSGGGTDMSEYGVFVWTPGADARRTDTTPLVWTPEPRSARKPPRELCTACSGVGCETCAGTGWTKTPEIQPDPR